MSAPNAHCNTLQRTATHCNALQHTATVQCLHLMHTATHCNTLQHTARHCKTLQHTATHCNCPVSASNATTGVQRCLGCLELQVSFRTRATNYRALLRKETYQDKASYASLPPCFKCPQLMQLSIVCNNQLSTPTEMTRPICSKPTDLNFGVFRCYSAILPTAFMCMWHHGNTSFMYTYSHVYTYIYIYTLYFENM